MNDSEKHDLLAVIRLPAGISPGLINRLRTQLERRGERVLIEQVKTLTAEETEQVATSLIESQELAANLAGRFKEKFGGKDRGFNPRTNLQARAVALGIRNWEELENGIEQADEQLGIPSHLSEAALILGETPPEPRNTKVTRISPPSPEELAAAAAGLDEEAASPNPTPDFAYLDERRDLVLQLRADYLAAKNSLPRR